MVFPFSSSPFHKDPKTYATPAPSAAPKTAAEAQLQLKQYDYSPLAILCFERETCILTLVFTPQLSLALAPPDPFSLRV